MGNFDVTTPAGSDLLSQGDDTIRELKVAIRESLRAGALAGDDIEGVEAIFPGSSPSTAPVYRYRGLKGTTAARPPAGQYGLYYDTNRRTLQRDNGTTWDDIAQNAIPSGTVMVFYQASAPIGWTSVSVNDKFLRVVTSGATGGSTGGTVAASTSMAHTHTVSSHTHSIQAHFHLFEYDVVNLNAVNYSPPSFSETLEFAVRTVDYTSPFDYRSSHTGWFADGDGTGALSANSATSGTLKTATQKSFRFPYTKTDGSSTSGGTSPSTDNGTLGAFAYADVIIASKNA